MIKTIVVLHQKIWCQQSGKEKIIYGRGSPEMNYTPTIAEDNKQKMFEEPFLLRCIKRATAKSMD